MATTSTDPPDQEPVDIPHSDNTSTNMASGASKMLPESPSEKSVEINSSLENLQTQEQRRVLDTIAQIRKCGLDTVISLPQLVVCGDQSAGKSSVLEALTEIPFPRNDNLCTRFATEIILRRAPSNSLTIKIIPDPNRTALEQSSIQSFKETITDLNDLPSVMNKATESMGIGDPTASKAFSRDVLSIEIEGPSRPQLTLVDIPGLIQSETKGVTKADIEMVADITDSYISQSRTICLAVVSATHDYANQRILQKVREVDSKGQRTLGIITKPDRLPSGSPSEQAFIELAKNEDIFFKLGWHVLKNRSFEKMDCSLEERRLAEQKYFRESNFRTLPSDSLGIDTLRDRLSVLLLEHVKREMPKLRNDLEEALLQTEKALTKMGERRSTTEDCKAFLSTFTLDYYEVCKAAVNGTYEGDFFIEDVDEELWESSPASLRRFRAVIQHMNQRFADEFRKNGSKYLLNIAGDSDKQNNANNNTTNDANEDSTSVQMSKSEALKWVKRALERTRGRELVGNYNPLLIAELFWEQSSPWQKHAEEYVHEVAKACKKFLQILLSNQVPREVCDRLWSMHLDDVLSDRINAAFKELERLIKDLKCYPMNYNHYYTDTITKRRQEREKEYLTKIFKDNRHNWGPSVTVTDMDQVIRVHPRNPDPDMDNVSCEEVLDCLYSIYKVMQKTFVANVTTQVIERHLVRDIEKILSPIIVNSWSNEKIASIVSEPAAAKRQRDFLEDRIAKLKNGRQVLKTMV